MCALGLSSTDARTDVVDDFEVEFDLKLNDLAMSCDSLLMDSGVSWRRDGVDVR